MVFGKLLFGIILGNIASALANAEIRRVKYEEKLGAIQVVPVFFFVLQLVFILPSWINYNDVCCISGAYVRSKHSRDSTNSGDELLRIYLE